MPQEHPAAAAAGGDDNHCLLGEDSVRLWYRNLLEHAMLHPDPHQEEAVEQLQGLAKSLVAPPPSGGFISRMLNGGRKQNRKQQGLYIHGSVGRGKSLLMDGFFLNLRTESKLRVHFHGFMRHFHADMKRLEGQPDPLAEVASRLAQGCRVICFDEFHVSDIADAMILARILQLLLDGGTILVATSNYSPDGLYPNGLARDRFLPAIELIKSRLQVHSLDGDTDYRMRALEAADRYLAPADAANRERFASMFSELALDIRLTPSVKVGSRRIPAVQRSSTAVWFEFAELCGGNWSQADYLQLAERFGTIFLSGLPRLGSENVREAARRFTWLIDVLYDARVKLAILAQEQLDGLYAGEGGESGRTLSRLREMQSHEYLETAVRAA